MEAAGPGPAVMKTHRTIESTNTWTLILIISHIMMKGSSYGETVFCLKRWSPLDLLLFSFFSGWAVDLAILTDVWFHVWTNQSQHNPNQGKVNLFRGCCSNFNFTDPGTLHSTSLHLGSFMFFTSKHTIVFSLGRSSNEGNIHCTDTFFISLLSCFRLSCPGEIQ